MRFAIIIGFLALAGCSGDAFATRSALGFDATLAAVKPVAEAFCRETSTAENCDFKIVIDDRPGQPPNAFQSLAPDGQPVLTFTTALIDQTENADELALIIAHEAAHHIEGHLGQQMRTVDGKPVSTALLARAIAAADGNRIDAARFGLMPAGAHVSQKRFELEADAMGAEIAARAGFNPARAAAIFRRLPDPVQHTHASHPTNAERYRTVLGVATTP